MQKEDRSHYWIIGFVIFILFIVLSPKCNCEPAYTYVDGQQIQTGSYCRS